MTAREFRCRECGYPFKTAEQGWARDAALMCPACGSTDVSIVDSPPRPEPVRMRAIQGTAGTTASGSTATDETTRTADAAAPVAKERRS